MMMMMTTMMMIIIIKIINNNDDDDDSNKDNNWILWSFSFWLMDRKYGFTLAITLQSLHLLKPKIINMQKKKKKSSRVYRMKATKFTVKNFFMKSVTNFFLYGNPLACFLNFFL